MKILITEDQFEKVIDNYITRIVDPVIDYKKHINPNPLPTTKIDCTWVYINEPDHVFAKYYLGKDGHSIFLFTSMTVELSLKDVFDLTEEKIEEAIRSWAMKHLKIKRYIKEIRVF